MSEHVYKVWMNMYITSQQFSSILGQGNPESLMKFTKYKTMLNLVPFKDRDYYNTNFVIMYPWPTH